MSSENLEKIKQAIELLQRVSEDTTVPRNIRRAAANAIKALQTETLTPAVRASNAISIIEEVSLDPNMPLHARTTLWNAVAILETIRD